MNNKTLIRVDYFVNREYVGSSHNFPWHLPNKQKYPTDATYHAEGVFMDKELHQKIVNDEVTENDLLAHFQTTSLLSSS